MNLSNVWKSLALVLLFAVAAPAGEVHDVQTNYRGWVLAQWAPVVTPASISNETGGAFPATGTWHYALAAQNSLGISGAGGVTNVTVATGDLVRITWRPAGGATNYLIYRGTAATSLTERAVVGLSTSYVDRGTNAWTTNSPASTITNVPMLLLGRAGVESNEAVTKAQLDAVVAPTAFINTLTTTDSTAVVTGSGTSRNISVAAYVGGIRTELLNSNATALAAATNAQALAASAVQRTDPNGHTNAYLQASTVAGGYLINTNNTGPGTVLGGVGNVASTFDVIGGGQSNLANGSDGGAGSVVGGGKQNTNEAPGGVVGGGAYNSAGYADYGTVAGGEWNRILQFTAAPLDGYATISGGRGHTVEAAYGTVAGGRSCSIGPDGHYGFAAGRRAEVTNAGSFVWADSQDASFGAAAANTFNIRAANGVYLTAGTDHNGKLVLAGNTHHGDGSGLTNTPLHPSGLTIAAFQAAVTNHLRFLTTTAPPTSNTASGSHGEVRVGATNLFIYIGGSGMWFRTTGTFSW